MTLINLVLFGFVCLCSSIALHLTIKILRPQTVYLSKKILDNPNWKVIRVYGPADDRIRVISTARGTNKIVLWLMARGVVWNWVFKILYLAVIGSLLLTTWIYFTLIFYCIQSIMWFLIAVNNWKSYKKVFCEN